MALIVCGDGLIFSHIFLYVGFIYEGLLGSNCGSCSMEHAKREQQHVGWC